METGIDLLTKIFHHADEPHQDWKNTILGKDFQAFWVGLVRRLTSAEFEFLFLVSNPYELMTLNMNKQKIWEKN